MCGILGLVALKGKLTISEKKLRMLTLKLKHRGPDEMGLYLSKKLALAQRRLRILDLSSKGKQPMFTSDKKLTIVFNGEIYNYLELRNELQKKGYSFKSTTDTEVLLYAFREWGINFLQRIVGMFAFFIYDFDKDEGYLVRDRLGVKPLYYSIHNQQLLFASEPKCILGAGVPAKPNLLSISSYLSYRYPLGNASFFEGISTVLPGQYLKIKGGKIEYVHYWDISIPRKKKRVSEQYSVSKLRKLLEKAVERRMLSDVPVGAYLSGGLDSTILVGLLAKQTKGRLNTYAIGFGDTQDEDLIHAQLAAKTFGIHHHEYSLTSRVYLQEMKKLIPLKDAPLAVPNEVAIAYLSKKLQKDITVVLSGEGADELFYGYGRIFRSVSDYEHMVRYRFLRFLPRFRKRYPKLAPTFPEHILSQYSYFPVEEKESFFSSKMLASCNHDKELHHQFFEAFGKVSYATKMTQLSYVFEKLHLPGLLGRLDTSTMSASVEGRVPFVDHELVEFLFTLPDNFKLRWKSPLAAIKSFFLTAEKTSEVYDTPKYLLRKAFSDLVPPSILTRKKVGFPVPLTQWFGKELMPLAKKELLSKDAKTRLLFDQKKLEKWLANPSTEHFGQKVWMLLNLEYWMRCYF